MIFHPGFGFNVVLLENMLFSVLGGVGVLHYIVEFVTDPGINRRSSVEREASRRATTRCVVSDEK